jgi:hypothetical protein
MEGTVKFFNTMKRFGFIPKKNADSSVPAAIAHSVSGVERPCLGWAIQAGS